MLLRYRELRNCYCYLSHAKILTDIDINVGQCLCFPSLTWLRWREQTNKWRKCSSAPQHAAVISNCRPTVAYRYIRSVWMAEIKWHAQPKEFSIDHTNVDTRAAFSPANRAKPCKFRYVKPVGNFIRKVQRSKEKTRIFNDRTRIWHHLTSEPRRISA